MSNEPETRKESAAAAYEALNASYRMMDEFLRQGQRVAETVWLPWLSPFLGTSSPFIPPEAWIRACGDGAMAWMSMAQEWTRAWTRWSGADPEAVACGAAPGRPSTGPSAMSHAEAEPRP